MRPRLTLGLFCLACAAALGAVWLHTGAPAGEPPQLTVTCRGQAVTAWRGTHSWHRTDLFGAGEGTASDSPHPLDVLEELPVLEADPGEPVLLSFPVRPDDITAERFALEGLETEQLTLESGNVLIPPERDSVYVVNARWEGLFGGGNAVYAFRLS